MSSSPPPGGIIQEEFVNLIERQTFAVFNFKMCIPDMIPNGLLSIFQDNLPALYWIIYDIYLKFTFTPTIESENMRRLRPGAVYGGTMKPELRRY